jgi:hypothetical protein
VMIPGRPCDASREGRARHRVSQAAGRVQRASHLTRGESVAYRTGVAPGYPVRNITVARDGAARNTGRSMNGLGSEAVPHVGRGVDGMEATAAKATAAMQATAMKSATVKTTTVKTTTVKTTTMETTAAVKASTVSASTVSAAPVTAATTSSLGNVSERQSQNCYQQGTRNNPRERQRDAFAVASSQHVCLHRKRR